MLTSDRQKYLVKVRPDPYAAVLIANLQLTSGRDIVVKRTRKYERLMGLFCASLYSIDGNHPNHSHIRERCFVISGVKPTPEEEILKMLNYSKLARIFSQVRCFIIP